LLRLLSSAAVMAIKGDRQQQHQQLVLRSQMLSSPGDKNEKDEKIIQKHAAIKENIYNVVI
jgi:hypothetical protein